MAFDTKTVICEIRTLIQSGSLSPLSVISIIRAAARLSPSWDVAEQVVRELAKGADGIEGTADDLIPQASLDMLSAMAHSGAARDLLEWVAELQTTAPKSCLSCLSAVWSWCRGGGDA
jgi:hypothetical protein